jgi:hypothetical protein
MKRLIIPDIHHRTAGADRILEAERADEVYFLGDYQDDFHDTPAQARSTALWMRRQIEAGHHLLWGNHDLPYAFLPELHDCPGYTRAKAAEVNKVLTLAHWKKLRLWYIIPGTPRPWILSHAGIERPWIPAGADPVPYLEGLEASAIEGLYERRTSHPLFFYCSAARGGRDPYSGPLWMDWGDFRPIPGLNQIVGHTPLRNPDEYSREDSTNWCIDTHLKHYAVLEDDTLSIRLATDPRS